MAITQGVEEQERRGKRQDVVFRFADTLAGIDGVMGQHMAVIKRQGCVWWGKIGKPLGVDRVTLLNNQIDEGSDTYVYLIQGKPQGFAAYRGRALRFAFDIETDRRAVPPLYRKAGLEGHVGVWVLLGNLEALRPERLNMLEVVSTHRPLREALSSSMSGMFIVQSRGTTGA